MVNKRVVEVEDDSFDMLGVEGAWLRHGIWDSVKCWMLSVKLFGENADVNEEGGSSVYFKMMRIASYFKFHHFLTPFHAP